MPLVLPPVGHWGRPLRDLVVSPALGISQLRGRGVEEKCRWVVACRAECMQQARVVKREESRDVGALMLLLLRVPTRIVAMIAQVVFPSSICIAITGTTYVGMHGSRKCKRRPGPLNPASHSRSASPPAPETRRSPPYMSIIFCEKVQRQSIVR